MCCGVHGCGKPRAYSVDLDVLEAGMAIIVLALLGDQCCEVGWFSGCL